MLGQIISKAKSDDPMSPVTVVVNNRIAQIKLRRNLALEATSATGLNKPNVTNVQFTHFDSIVRSFYGRLYANSSTDIPIESLSTQSQRNACLIRALQARGIPVANFRGTSSSLGQLYSTMEQISFADPQVLSKLGNNSELAKLYTTFCDMLRNKSLILLGDIYSKVLKKLADKQDPLVNSGPFGTSVFSEFGQLVFYLARTSNYLTDNLILAIYEWYQRMRPQHDGEISLVFQTVLGQGEDLQDDKLHSLFLTEDNDGEAPAEMPPNSNEVVVNILSTPEPDEEVRAVVRRILDSVQLGTPIHQIALFYSSTNPYKQLIHDQLTGAAIPFNGAVQNSLAQVNIGKFVLGLFDFISNDFHIRRFADWIVASNLRPRIQESTSMQVSAFTIAKQLTIAEFEPGSDVKSTLENIQIWLARKCNSSRALANVSQEDQITLSLTHLLVKQLTYSFGKLTQASTWSELSSFLIRIVDYFFPDDVILEEKVKLQIGRVIDAIDELSSNDQSGINLDLVMAGAILNCNLESAKERHGLLGSGITVGPLGMVDEVHWEETFLLGCTDGWLPFRKRGTPLFQEESDVLAKFEISSPNAEIFNQWKSLHLLLANSNKCTLSFPRSKQLDASISYPSLWLAELADTVSATNQTMTEGSRSPVSTPSFRIICEQIDNFQTDRLSPISLQDFDITSVENWNSQGNKLSTHYLSKIESSFARVIECRQRRKSGSISEWEGSLAADKSLLEMPVSASRLIKYLSCPFSYFLSNILKISTLEPDDLQFGFSALQRGQLIHEILDKVYSRCFLSTTDSTSNEVSELSALIAPKDEVAKGRSCTLEMALRNLEDVATEIDQGNDYGHASLPLILKQELFGQIVAEVRKYIIWDFEQRNRSGNVPIGCEVCFDQKCESNNLKCTQDIAWRGRIDRIDYNSESGFEVIDYKTGKKNAHSSGSFSNDLDTNSLQLAVYIQALANQDANATVTASIHHITPEEYPSKTEYIMESDQLSQANLVFDEIVRGIREGNFPAIPGPASEWRSNSRIRVRSPHSEFLQSQDELYGGDRFENCRFCGFNTICPTDRDLRWNKIRKDKNLGSVVGLIEAIESEGD